MASHNPPARRLSQRRGSMAAPDPFLQHEVPAAASSSSRITIVRVPSAKENTPPSPGTHSRDIHSRTSDRDPSSSARRSSWGSAKSGSSETSAGRGKGRLSFAFATFTPIEPPAQAAVDRYAPTSSAPPSPGPYKAKGSSSFSTRAANLTPQQIYEVAQQATNPTKSHPGSPVYGYGGLPLPASSQNQEGDGIQAAPFIPLPSEVYLPFIQRPQEVSQLLATPQTGRLFALLASTFPQESGAGAISRPSSRPSSSMGMLPQHTGGSTYSVTHHLTFSELPEDPRIWTFSELNAWLRYVTRQEADDREWVRKIRMCINSRSEVLWQRFAGALGVPAGFEEEEGEDTAVADEEEFSGSESRFVGIGRTVHSSLAPSGLGEDTKTSSGALENENEPSEVADNDSVLNLASEFGGEEFFEDEGEDDYDSSLPGSSAVIEPITASSLPLPPTASGLTSPLAGPGFSAGEAQTHSLGDVREEEEEAEMNEEATTSEANAAQPTKIKPPLPKHISGLVTSSGGQREYVPRTPSPLAALSTSEKAAEEHVRPTLHVSTPTTSTTKSSTTEAAVTHESEIDFGEPDPNAEAIQGLRIMNSPMNMSGGVPSRVMDESFASSPAQWNSPHHEAPPPSSLSGVPAVPGLVGNRPRTGSNSSSRELLVNATTRSAGSHQRTQSFGLYHTRRMSGSSLARGHVGGGAGLTGNAERGPGNPLFPSSFAGLSVGPTLSVNNPRLRHLAAAASGRHAGISLGGGMHHTPRLAGGLRQKPGKVINAEYAVSESDQS